MNNKTIRTRIAPSPTGNLHVGTARAALYNELFARKNKGQFILRIEDTDKERSEAKYEKNIIDGLKWLGLKWNEGPDIGGDYGPYRQSERKSFYVKAIRKLLDTDQAYKDKKSDAIILRVKPQEIVFNDLIRGEVKTHSDAWGGDFVIARSLEDPVFHLAVVVDDAEMKITHVIRGEDHISNTARHILIQRALEVEQPQYAHLPLLLDDQRKKLSKRAGEVSVLAYKDKGYLPAAMLNYLALLGWNPGNDEEFLKHEEIIDKFSLKQVQKGGAIFSTEKLNSINKGYLQQLSAEKLFSQAEPFLEKDGYVIDDQEYWIKAIQTEQERVNTLAELPAVLRFFDSNWSNEYAPEMLVWKQSDKDKTIVLLEKLITYIASLDDFSEKELQEKIISWIDENELGRGDTLWPMRVALTGKEKSPGPFEIATVLGKKETLRRLEKAINILKK